MTDQDMDDRLRAAGARWRDENTVATLDDSTSDEILVQPAPHRSRHRWLTAASAAIVTAALVVGGLYFLRHDESPGNGQPLAETSQQLIGPTWTMPTTGLTLVFSTSQVRSTFLCSKNTYALAIDGDRLQIGDTVGTHDECSYPDPGPARQAGLERYSKVATGTVTWSVDRNTLTLTKPGVGSISLTRPADLTDLAGVNWGLQGEGISLVFAGDVARVSAGCFGSEYRVTLAGDVLTLGDVIGSNPACPGGPSGAAAKFAEVVSGRLTVQLAGNTLTLSKSGVGTIELTSLGTAAELVGTDWALKSIVDGKGNLLSHVRSSTLLHIGRDGALTTDDQCGNGIGGTVDTTDTTFTFRNDVAHTEIGCGDQVLNDGATVIGAVLSGTVTWTILDNELTLTKAGSDERITYSVATPATPQLTTLADTSWNLTMTTTSTGSGASGSASATPSADDTSLTFTGDAFTLAADCTEWTGTVAFDTGTITLSGVDGGIRPNVRCAANPARQNQEALLGKLFSNGVLGWTVTNGALTLTHFNVGGVFDPAKASTTHQGTLSGTAWSLLSTETDNGNSGNGNSALSLSSLSLRPDGTFTLTHHCYSRVGKFTTDGDTVTFSGVTGGSALPCPSNAESFQGQRENNFVDAIISDGAVTFAIDSANGNLSLTRGNRKATFMTEPVGAEGLRANHWTLSEIHENGASLQPSAAAEFNFASTVVAGENLTADATITDATIDFTGPWTVQANTVGGSRLSAAEHTFVYDKVLTGKVGYVIDADTLTIQNGAGALVFTKLR